MPALPGQQQPPTTHGPVNAVPCPHCGKPNDLRELDGQQLLDTGHGIECDVCHRLYDVVGIRTVKVVVLRASSRAPNAGQPDAQPARTVSPGILRRLLGR